MSPFRALSLFLVVIATLLTGASFVEAPATYTQALPARLQTQAHLVCAKGQGQEEAAFMTLLGPVQVRMTWATSSVPHPEFCAPGTVLGSTCMMAARERKLLSCTYGY